MVVGMENPHNTMTVEGIMWAYVGEANFGVQGMVSRKSGLNCLRNIVFFFWL